MNILELAILKKMVGGGGGSGTDNYNDLSNLPQINDETLAGNKTAENLGLQDALTFDSAPTEDSTNPVESGGVYNALAGKQDNLTFDDDPTENSTNPVKSGGVYNALAGKQDNLTFDGVYNASTNKAATESTVTNAIAGLDVSALSVDADETISSISETDGKISVTKQDIAIASNQVTAMTGYTKPSSAPATPAIQQDDTANAAIGKLEYKADVNQTNILYALNTGVKNIINVPDQSQTNGTTVQVTDGVVKVTGTSTSNAAYTLLEHINLKAGTYYLSGGIGGTAGENFLRLGTQATDAYIMANYSDTPSEFTLNNDTECKLRVYTQGTNLNLTYYPMISILSDGEYVSYALPNYDLTRMVSELQKKAVKVYTYHVNPNESDPEDAVTYLDDAAGLTPAKMGASSFSYGSWANAWFLPRPCVLKFDGTVDYYLNPNDYSKKTDGTASTIDSSNSTGNVMLEFPKIWVKRVNDGNGARTVSIAPVNVDGTYKCWSNINAEDKEVDHFYLPAYNGTIHSSKMRSLSGVTLNATYAPNYTRAQEVTAATANNPTGKNMWYTETWADFCLVYDLLYLMGKSLDVQRTFGQGLSSGSETAMRAYVTGTHNAKGLFYGDISGTSTAVKVLGMENLWGCRWHGVAGLINDNGTLKVKMTYGVADGSTAAGYNTTGSGYLNYGSTYGTNGYVKKMQADNTMGYKIVETAGTDATYYCDYYYVNNSISAYALLGGRSGSGADCGFCVALNHEAALASWLVGGSLSCRP